MGAIEDIRQVLQDFVTPDLKAIDARLTSLENTVERNHGAVMRAIDRLTDYHSVVQRIVAIEERLGQKQQ